MKKCLESLCPPNFNLLPTPLNKSRKTKTNIDKRPQILTHTPKQNSILPGENPVFNNKATTVAAHPIIKNVHNTKGVNQENEPIPLTLTTEVKNIV